MLINKRALKIACISRCKKPIKGPAIIELNIIKPKCLKVDRATTFFRSFSIRALILEKKIVSKLLKIIKFMILSLFRKKK